MNTIYDDERVQGSSKIKREFKSDQGDIFVADALDMLGFLPNESIDLCIFDAAYESMEDWRKYGTTTRLTNKWFPIFTNDKFLLLFSHLFRVMKFGSHVYVLCDDISRDLLLSGYSHRKRKPLMNKDGKPCLGQEAPIPRTSFRCVRTLIWDKMCIGMGYYYRAQYECIIFLSKLSDGKHRKVTDLGAGDVIQVKRLKGPQYYPTEKPPALIWKLISQSSSPGEVVLDMFCGSGTVPLMASLTGRKFIGSDISPKAIRWSIDRIKRKEIGYPAGRDFNAF